MKRILLFLLTNFAILLVASFTLRLLGVEPWLNQQGINFQSLLIFGAVLGFGGAFVSLAISKWMAKRMMGVQVIAEPRNEPEMWLVETGAARHRRPASACRRSAFSSRRRPMPSPLAHGGTNPWSRSAPACCGA